MLPHLDLPVTWLMQLTALLELHAPEAEVWAYGSRVRGNGHAGSDLDIVLRDPAQPERPQRGMAALREALAQSTIPILVDVLDWARLPESFKDEIRAGHVVLKPAGPITQPTAG